MRFKVDENLPAAVAERLQQAQHDAHTILDEQLGGHPDSDVAQVCLDERRALVTLDLDFSNIRQYPPEDYPGIIVLRPGVQSIPAVLQLMTGVISLLGQEPLEGHLWVVDERRVRIRGSNASGSP
jgi:predicted nuclease of predicted toxin-antitoxin system